jgi:hypothetical protein
MGIDTIPKLGDGTLTLPEKANRKHNCWRNRAGMLRGKRGGKENQILPIMGALNSDVVSPPGYAKVGITAVVCMRTRNNLLRSRLLATYKCAR